MSLTGVSPLITSWIELGLEWRWHWIPVRRPFAIPANGQVQIPSEAHAFRAPEGVLLTFNAAFDHPDCGIRYEAYPELDTEDFFTISRFVGLGASNMPFYITTLIPPASPPGLFSIVQSKEWPWTEWARLYVINTDSVPHTCFAYGYTMALLKEPRPKESI